LSIGFYFGESDERKSLPCLLGFLIEWINWMAKYRLKVQEEIRFMVLQRAMYKCERCGGGATAFGFSVHHRLPRGMGGSKNSELHKPANLITLCGSGVDGCHGWVESNREQARLDGYLLFRIDSASEIPFKDNEGNLWLINNFGEKKRFDTINVQT
jgi:hypothetical protein